MCSRSPLWRVVHFSRYRQFRPFHVARVWVPRKRDFLKSPAGLRDDAAITGFRLSAGADDRAALWFDFGHQHHGLTLGPATGRLLVEMMTGETPFADPRPFAVERFG